MSPSTSTHFSHNTQPPPQDQPPRPLMTFIYSFHLCICVGEKLDVPEEHFCTPFSSKLSATAQ
ncbi:hypothetical protein EV363DRAFT_1265740 [Boletus edulis]|nr:hypothetical protein EV363DRAFT_1265740 [Boletus edulis]